MKYVDEFRNADLARAVSAEISSLVDPKRHYKIMEVCGGHTHTIYRHGIKDLLPDQIELVHGPGCPVCVLPMGRVDDGIAVAERHLEGDQHGRRPAARRANHAAGGPCPRDEPTARCAYRIP